MKYSVSSLLALLLVVVSMQAIDVDASTKKCKAKSTLTTTGSTASTKAASGTSTKAASGTSTKSSSASSSTSTKSTSSGSSSDYTPNGIKAGVSSGNSVKYLGSNIGSWNDWGAAGGNDHKSSSALYVPMLWGNGDNSANTGLSGTTNSDRMAQFDKLTAGANKYVMGFNEFDYHGTGSSGLMTASAAASMWDEKFGPWKEAGSILISPSCAKQADESLLTPFLAAATVKPDCIAVHIFRDSLDGIKETMNHYLNTYSDYDCFWITEFAYANYQNGAHNYGTVSETNALIAQAVDYFESLDKVKAYFISDADNGPNGTLTSSSGLTSAGQAYLAAISKYASTSRRRAISGNHAQRHVRRAAAASRRSARSV